MTGSTPPPAGGTLSVIVPCYNERNTLGPSLLAVAGALPGVSKEIVVVDDGSTDGTRDWLQRNVAPLEGSCATLALDAAGELTVEPAAGEAGTVRFRLLLHERNRGKGAALRTGFAACGGDVIVVQDADLEYDPADWAEMYPLIAERGVADVVYGARFYGRPHRTLYYHHYVGNRIISMVFSALYNQHLRDVEVCYKMLSRRVLDSLHLTADGFGIEVEISSRIARARHWRIYEVGISYYGRTYAEGKKIDWRDGVKALWYLIWYRIA